MELKDLADGGLAKALADPLEALLAAAPFAADDDLAVLELGAGRGALTERLASRFPGARFTLIEASEDKLADARVRLQTLAPRLDFRCVDLARVELATPFDLIVSAFALHQLGAIEKRALLRQLYSVTARGGAFICADVVRPPNSALDDFHWQRWRAHAAAAGASETDLAIARSSFVDRRRATLEDQIEWLRNAGFRSVDLYFKHWGVAVFGGRRATV